MITVCRIVINDLDVYESKAFNSNDIDEVNAIVFGRLYKTYHIDSLKIEDGIIYLNARVVTVLGTYNVIYRIEV